MPGVKKWLNKVIVIPHRSLPLSKEASFSPLHIINNNPCRLAFKLKTTRSNSLKPNVTCGFLDPGSCVHIKVTYAPKSKEKLHGNDRLTILMKPVYDESKDWEACLIDTKESPCGRVVLKLQSASPDTIGIEEDDSTSSTS